jgi:predicted MFS family arabinose efflux permease
VHGITGSLGWALAPVMLVPLAIAFSWRVSLMAAGTLAFGVLAVLLINRDRLQLPELKPAANRPGGAAAEGSFGFLAVPAVWMCFAFFLVYAAGLSVMQTFAPEAARQLHAVPPALVAMCLTAYMLASAGGMVLGGFLASNAERCERVVGAGFGVAAVLALVLALGNFPGTLVPVIFAAMGFCAGIAGPSRDLLVKRSTPANATGRVYGVVYSGLDIGQAIAPLFVGRLMDSGRFSAVLISLAAFQGLLIVNAFNVGRIRRPVAAVPA